MLALIIVQLLCAVGIKCQMGGKIVQGDRVDISSFAYAAFLFIKSRDKNFVCGASIINQRILLTAAHCIEHCSKTFCAKSIFIGNEDINKGMKIPLKGFIIHEHFDRELAINDIALVAVQGKLKFSEFVKRVAILDKPPNFKVAAVAGWGLIDTRQNIHTHYLHAATQRIWPLEECRKVINVVRDGTFCGGELYSHQYASGPPIDVSGRYSCGLKMFLISFQIRFFITACSKVYNALARGDSGSALVADGYVQLGLVSFIRPKLTRSIVIYTNVPFYYRWIMQNARKLHCRSNIS